MRGWQGSVAWGRRGACVLAVLCTASSPTWAADPVSFDSHFVRGEWGVFADDADGFQFPDQGVFDLEPGAIGESWSQADGIARAETFITGLVTGQTSSDGGVFAGDLHLGVRASVDGDGDGFEQALATLSLTDVLLNVTVLEAVDLEVSGRSVREVLVGLGDLGEGVHRIEPGQYRFEVTGTGIFLDAQAQANQADEDGAVFGWSMTFVIPTPGSFGVLGVGLMLARQTPQRRLCERRGSGTSPAHGPSDTGVAV